MIEKVKKALSLALDCYEVDVGMLYKRLVNDRLPLKEELEELKQRWIDLRILSIKVGNTTLKQLAELLEQGKLVKLSDSQRPAHSSYRLFDTQAELRAYDLGRKDVLQAGFKKVEPL